MRHATRILSIILALLLSVVCDDLRADINNNLVINHEIARRIETLQEENGYSTEDFNACQITWTVRPLKQTNPNSRFQPHEVAFFYENREVVRLVNSQDGDAQSIQGLGLNCMEFNSYVYLFFDTLDYRTRDKFGLTDLSYVIYSADAGGSWSDLQGLDPFSVKAQFILPHQKFHAYVKVFGNRRDHVLSIFNLRDETTYLFDPAFKVLKTVPVYNRLTDYKYPSDFYYYRNILYLVRGSCEEVKGHIQCPSRTYMETSRDLGRTWEKEVLPYMKKSYFLTLNKVLHHFYFQPCSGSLFGFVPAFDHSYVCGNIRVRTLNILGQWEKPKTLIKTAEKLLGVYDDIKPILVWKDYRFHKSRACAFIPFIGCVDAEPVRGPAVIYAGTLDIDSWQIAESIIEYQGLN